MVRLHSDDALQRCQTDGYSICLGIFPQSPQDQFPQSPQDHMGNLNASGGLANAIVKGVIADGHNEIILSGLWVALAKVKVWGNKIL